MRKWSVHRFEAMPKVELHLHLDGALRPETALELAANARGKGETFANALPADVAGMRDILVIKRRLRSQRALLNYFDVPVALMQTRDALMRVTAELLEGKAADNVRYCEIRFAPRLHTRAGLTAADAVRAVLAAAQAAGAEHGVRSAVVAVALRGEPLRQNMDLLNELAPFCGHGFVAVDFAGVEEEHPDPCAQAEFFEKAHAMGLGVTFHCGEIPGAAGALSHAVETLRPARVAHGACAVEDPALCALLAGRGVQLDLCPTANIQAGLYADYAAHPFAQLLRAGVPVSLSTDSPTLTGHSLSEEYARVADATGLSMEDLWQMNRESAKRAFAPEEALTALA